MSRGRASLCGAMTIAIVIFLAGTPFVTSDAKQSQTSTIQGDDAVPASTAATPSVSPPPAQDDVAQDDDEESAALEAKFRAKREKQRRQNVEAQAKKKAEAEAAKERAAQEAAKEAEANKVRAEEQHRGNGGAERERHGTPKSENQQEGFKPSEAEAIGRARTHEDDPRDAAVPGEMDELELERRAFEQAEKAVRDEEARQEALRFAAEEAQAAEELSRQATDRARLEAQRLFNEQDLVRRRRGAPDNIVAQKVYNDPPLRCALCHVVVIGARGTVGRAAIEKLLSLGESVKAVARTEKPGVVAVPRWFAELMSKARFRGISLTWEVADVTKADSLDHVFAGAKAAIFAVTATPKSDASLNREPGAQTPEAVDNLGLANVARKAGEHAVERLIVISQAGVTRPVLTSLNTALWGSWSRWPQMAKAMHWNLLKHKRLGELAAVRECRETRGETTYTIIRPVSMGNTTHEGAWAVAPRSIATHIGDNIQDGRHAAVNTISRAQVAAIAVEAIFTEAAINRVVEVTGSVDGVESAKQRGSPASRQGSGSREKSGKAPGKGEANQDGDAKEGSVWETLFSKHRPGIGSYMSAEDMRRMAMLSDIKNNMLMLAAQPSGSGHESAEAAGERAVTLAHTNPAPDGNNVSGHAAHTPAREL